MVELVEIAGMSENLIPLMKVALQEAEKGLSKGEVPVGAVLTDPRGIIVARSHNLPITLHDPTAHAEVLALRKGGAFYKNYRLPETTLIVTKEPCPMCMGAAVNARIKRLVFGAFDPKAGAAGSLYNLAQDNALNHQIEVVPGFMEETCMKMLQDFFQDLRRKKRTQREEIKKS